MTSGEPAIRLAGLAKRFGTVPAVAGLDLTVPAGETVALLGPNGAGKSTTISMLLGLVRPDAGEVRLLGGSAASASGCRGRTGPSWHGCPVSEAWRSGVKAFFTLLGRDDMSELERGVPISALAMVSVAGVGAMIGVLTHSAGVAGCAYALRARTM